MNISINPTYYCNFRCEFCYLTNEQLSDRRLLDLTVLEMRLVELLSYGQIEQVDIYGGEVGLLPYDYFIQMKSILQMYGVKNINVITNLSMINDIVLDDDCTISVSYDFDARQDHLRVYKNMALLDKPFSILMLASPKLISKDVDEMVNLLNLLDKLVSVEIKPYSSNQANQLDVSFTDYEEFVKKWILNPNKKFELVNEKLIESTLDKTRNSFSDDHIYITPSGNYAVLEFDLNDNEFFLEYDSAEQYFEWCVKEKARTKRNKFCGSCEHYGHCLSEHLREVQSLDNSCNGFKNLINWYARLED